MHGEGQTHGAHEHPPFLQHHFDTPAQQYDSTKLGMWLFLATEILLFGGLFCVYAVYRGNHPEIFVYAQQFLSKKFGAINTVILLCSSLTMAWGVRAAQLGQRKLLVALLGLTLLGGAGFMGIKYVEYKGKFEHGLLWARNYSHGEHAEEEHGEEHPLQPSPADQTGEVPGGGELVEAPTAQRVTGLQIERSQLPGAGRAPGGLVTPDERPPSDAPANVFTFFGVYFLMTGLHGLHVLAGMGAIAWLAIRALGGAYSAEYFTPVELVGLYWHLVDLIWIFLFPLLYLIG